MTSLIKGLPALFGVIGGTFLFVLNVSQRAFLHPFFLQLICFTAIGVMLLFIGKRLIGVYPRVSMILIEFWILPAICLTAGCTFLLLWLTLNAHNWFPNIHDDDTSKAVVGAIVGCVTTFLANLLTKDIEEAKGFFWPSTQFKKALASTFKKNNLVPEGDTKEWDAVYEERVRGKDGPHGWDLVARWKRATIMSDYLKVKKSNSSQTASTDTR